MCKKYLKKIVFLAMLILPIVNAAPTIFKSEFLNVPGGILLHEVSKNQYIHGIFSNNKKILTIRKNDKFYLVYGIPYGIADGPQSIYISNRKSDNKINFIVKEKVFKKQHITVSKKYIQPSDKDIARIIKERNILSSYRDTWSSNDPDINFIHPAKGVTTGIFGTERYYNNQKGRYHNGIDIAGNINNPIFAPSSGRIMLTGNFFYNGKFVYIDHGKGLLSIFIHLNEITVKKGTYVNKGDVIGKIGVSGRSTGPHVHWSLTLNQNYIDPMIFLTINKNN
tara:strand:- start:399 stop:1238 length:840 start_codon:yes stop_codon:yes gene_type:complete